MYKGQEHTPYVDEYGAKHDVVIKRTEYSGRVKIENVPPDEFLISRESKSIEDARFVCHRVQKTLSELRLMYPDEDLDGEELGGGDDDIDAFSSERLSRYQFDDSANYFGGWAHLLMKRLYKLIGCTNHLSKQTMTVTALQS